MTKIKAGELDIEYHSGGESLDSWTWYVILTGYGHENFISRGRARTEKEAIYKAKRVCRSFANGILKGLEALK